MARKIVAIHGIGNAQPGWSEFLRLELDVPEEDWIEFCYDDLMDQSIINRVLVTATRLYLGHAYGPEATALASVAEDYVNDVIAYFLSKPSRLKIQLRLKNILQEHPDAVILSHSLGTVVAYETLKNYGVSAHTLLTMGSPLSKSIVRRFLRVPDFKRPKVVNWFNIWGVFDPVGGKIKKLGCKLKDQYGIRNAHDLLVYVHSQKERILSVYRESRELVS